MKINNNLNNNKQVNFNAGLKAYEGVNAKLATRLAKIAKSVKGTRGDVVTIRQKIVPNSFDKSIHSYISEFDYFKKNDIFISDKKKIVFSTSDYNNFDLWEEFAEKPSVRNLDEEGRDNKIVEFFQGVMDSVSKK